MIPVATSTQDALIVGAGFSGLTLAAELLERGPPGLRLSIVDPRFDPQPARTWCFWGDVPAVVAPYVERTWTEMRVQGPRQQTRDTLHRRPYHLLSGAGLTRGLLTSLRADPRVEFVRGTANEVADDGDRARVRVGARTLTASYVFHSHRPPSGSGALLQHFGGWEVVTDRPCFAGDPVTLMDFRTDQRAGPSFFYVLPLGPGRALIEYTRISRRAVRREEYDAHVQAYLRERVPAHWTVARREYGIIPMDPRPVDAHPSPRVFGIGRAGGMTKPSTGYTVRRSLRQAESLARTWRRTGQPRSTPPSPARFGFYDRLFLRVLAERPELGAELFLRLFGGGRFDEVLGFLDEESSWLQEARLVSRLPFGPFLGALFDRRRVLAPIGATT
jgi:lycopene beta-cyclase